MAFNPKTWLDGRAGGTRIDAAAMVDLEQRLSGYTDQRIGDVVDIGGIDLSEYTSDQVPGYDPGTDALRPRRLPINVGQFGTGSAALEAALDRAYNHGPSALWVPDSLVLDAPILETRQLDIVVQMAPGTLIDLSNLGEDANGVKFDGSEAAGVSVLSTLTTSTKEIPVADGAEADFHSGDMVRIYSSDKFDPYRTNTNNGELGFVDYVVTGKVVLRNPLTSSLSYVTSPKIVNITQAAKVQWYGGTFLGGGVDLSQVGLAIRRSDRPVISGVRAEFCEDAAFIVQDSVDFLVDKVRVNDSEGSNTGYGVDVVQCQGGTVQDSIFRRCRHATTVAAASALSTPGGISRRILFTRNWGVQSISKGDLFDTHATGEWIDYIENTVVGAANSGFNFECASGRVLRNRVFGAVKHGVYACNYTAAPTDHQVEDNVVYDVNGMGVRWTTPLEGAGSADQTEYVSVRRNRVYRAKQYAVLAQSRFTAKCPNVYVEDNHGIDCLYSVSIFANKLSDASWNGNRATGVPGNATGVRVNACERGTAQRNRSDHLSSVDTLATTLSGAITGNETSFPLASTAGLATKGIATIDGVDYSYTGIGGGALTGITRPVVAVLDEPLAAADSTATVDDASDLDATGSILIDTEVIPYTAIAGNVLTLGARTGAADHAVGAAVMQTRAHANGAAVSFAAGIGFWMTGNTDVDGRGSGSTTAYYGTRLNSTNAYCYADRLASRGAAVPLDLGTAASNAVSPTTGSDLLILDELLRSADARTLPREVVDNTIGTIVSGNTIAARLVVSVQKSYSQIRFATGTTAPSGLTDLKASVFDATTGAVVATTANSSATVTLASTLYTLNLTAPVTLNRGIGYFAGLSFLGTTPPTIRGRTTALSAINAETPAVSSADSGWAGGTPPTINAATGGGRPWMELV